MKRRAPAIPASSLAETVRDVLEQHASACLDNAIERAAVGLAIINALDARPEAVAIRAAFAAAPTQVTKIVVMREIGGDAEGELLAAAARLAGAT